MLLKDKVAVVYGAAGAVGSVVSKTFAGEGARLFLAGRTYERVDRLADDLTASGALAAAAQVDALDKAQVEAHIEDVVRAAGRIDISLNLISAGYVHGTPFVDLPLEDFVPGITNCMRTQFLTATAAARHMAKQGAGAIMMLTATPARVAIPNTGNFGVACAAMEGFSRQLAGELGSHGVRVVCLRSAGSIDAPGVDQTFDVLAERAGLSRAEFEKQMAQRTLLERLPKLAEVANVAAFMASDRASAITGAVANVTCGETLD
jgi:NAD(P)-dependent dehydrogenase (short-subunit alcohol dehydrogenase family)